MIYRRSIRVEFNHCDPAGIVFYPRYFEMTNSVCEGFFRDVARYSFAAMMAAGEGAPTARMQADFHAPSRLEDMLDWRLSVEKLGRSSIGFRIEAHCGSSHRMTALPTLVLVDEAGRPQPWPTHLRDRITAFMEEPDEP
ncbi:acyl-CoA thioesterase [Defluviimonas sp. WL0002]|uniref:Acyl-CoA thioesterase n=1 Tax=Albidovulum marisflavi TaxID=2984159 RepID=A0ABT2ZBR7_9RHOB|nr:thioesterase family protein [Defluviimonas sp. WL0002]MCV2868495.1 acyl-CoA thioesterase [Defluviimonas sp. WL0002]